MAAATTLIGGCVAVGLGLIAYLWHTEPQSAARRSLILFLCAGTVECLCAALQGWTSDASGLAWVHRVRLLAVACMSGPLVEFSLTYARGNYREIMARRRGLVRVAYVLPVAVVIATWTDIATVLVSGEGAPGPLLRLGASAFVLQVLILLSIVFSLMNLERTLRESIGTMRWRVKYTVLGIAVFGTVRVYTGSQEVLYGSLDATFLTLNAFAFLLMCALLFVALRRGRLMSVDIYVSDRVLVHSVTLVLAGLYLLTVGLLASLVEPLGGASSLPFRSFVVLLALLGAGMALLSNRLRQKVHHFVGLHFLRPRHDYRRIWNMFTQRTASVMQMPAFCREAVQVVAQIFEALSVTLWLVDETGSEIRLGESTILDQAAAQEAVPPQSDVSAILTALSRRTEPVDLQQRDEDWARQLLQANPASFKTGQTICIPLRMGGQWLGLLLIGDRINATPFTGEDLALVKTVGEYVGARLLTFRLSNQLLAAREMEAFQIMSTFFVHDLKNLASTLSLMLKNLARHFDDPAFREDAVKTISSTVDKIHLLISRLALLRGKPMLHPAPTDLNALVEEVVDELSGVLSASTHLNPGPLPSIPLDEDEMRQVVTNLVMNASDASTGGGRIDVTTAREGEYATLVVRDEGVGMAPEFVSNSLFKPFQSTKKNGLGIGLFHCKRIVEGHGGRIQVDSEAGRGTAFRIFLPVAATGDVDGNDPDRG